MRNHRFRIAGIVSLALGLLVLAGCQKKPAATDTQASTSKMSSRTPTWAERYPR